MKNEKWTEDLYLYHMKPAPLKRDDFQEYIALYFAEKDENTSVGSSTIMSQG